MRRRRQDRLRHLQLVPRQVILPDLDTGDSQTGGAPLATGALMTTLSAKVGNRRATCKGPRPPSARVFAMHDGLAKLLASEGTGIGSGRIMPIRHRSLAIALQRLFPVA